jgi:hypothetical protein
MNTRETLQLALKALNTARGYTAALPEYHWDDHAVRDAIAAIEAELAKPQAEPDIGDTLDKFLCNGTRIKLNFNKAGNMTSLQNMAHDLQGRWVALVPAENDCHLKPRSPAPTIEPLTADEINTMWHDALKYADPTSGDAHIRLSRAIEAAVIAMAT